MQTLLWEVTELPPKPLDAAADFYERDLPEIRDDCAIHQDRDVVLVFAAASHEHCAWRLAAVQELAREMAPRRINAVSGGSADSRMEALGYLAAAPGVTGQYIVLDDTGAGSVIGLPA